jgi:hypothetical protein
MLASAVGAANLSPAFAGLFLRGSPRNNHLHSSLYRRMSALGWRKDILTV